MLKVNYTNKTYPHLTAKLTEDDVDVQINTEHVNDRGNK
jgi:hypothetical protein